MTKYEYDKQIATQLPPLTAEGIKQAITDIENFLAKQKSNQYLMLLSNELNYYTIFNKKKTVKTIYGISEEIMNFILEDSFLMGTVGPVKLVEENSNSYMEIWIGNEHFALFPCDQLVVNI